MSLVPKEISSIELCEEYKGLTPEELHDEAADLVFNDEYMDYKARIRENVSQCTEYMIEATSKEYNDASGRLPTLLGIQTALIIVFLFMVITFVIYIATQVRKPLTKMTDLMMEEQMVEPTGAEELRFVSKTYNNILEQNRVTQEKLSHQASHDALTGLFNRGAYDLLMENVDKEHMALLVCDVDHFKQINDKYGHAIGDRVLKRVAEILQHSFRSVDIICRFGGDEFVVVMTRANSSMRQLVENKINKANEILMNPQDDLPPVSLSVGVAFSDRENPQGDIFEDADLALYRVKEAGRRGINFYE